MFSDWRFFALASAVFAALTAILGKVGVQSINSNLATFIRTIVIIAFTAALLTARDEWASLESLSRKSILFLVLSGLATGASWLCYYRALQMGPASKVAPLEKVSVAITILLAIFILGDKADWKTIVGGVLIVAGSIVLAL